MRKSKSNLSSPMYLNLSDTIILQYLFGVGSKKIYRVAEIPEGDLLQKIHQCGWKIREENKVVSVTERHLEQAGEYAEKIIEKSKETGVGFLCYGDVAYPEILRKTVNEKGELTPPLLLYTKGDVSALNTPCVTIAGTRHPSPDGAKIAGFVAGEFVREGFCVVSGLAAGCDAVAHESALREGGKTIAFMAHGLHQVYPPENRALADRMLAQGGLLLSEFPFGASCSKYGFIARDRLQAGLSLATVVVQTDVNGGSMHVANATLAARKPLFTIYFEDEKTRSLDISKGNASLVAKGARYLKESDDLHRVAERIIHQSSLPTSLF